MNILESIRAWFSGLLKKGETMTEVTDTPEAPADSALAATAAVVEVPVAATVVVTAVNTDTLKSILAALGHDLDAVWEDAIALAKKAL